MMMGLSNWLITIKRKLIFTLKTPKIGLVEKRGKKKKREKKTFSSVFYKIKLLAVKIE
jgi:hypothetical protein